RGENGDMTLAWFAIKTGNEVFYEKGRFLRDPTEMGKLSRWAGAGLVWLSQFEEDDGESLPLAWKGDGSNPVVFFRTEEGNPNKYYFGGKGGRGSVNHGNMDAGSFIFELNGVRWVIDPGNQKYHNLEKTGFNLWGRCQECERWTLLTKNNYGHSTVTVNNALHHVDGFASITDFQDGEQPEATIDMTEVFGDEVASATRRFVKEDNQSLLIEDQIVPNDSTQHITWQLMTTADVDIVQGGATLKQDGKELKLENLSHPDLTVSMISLDPTPLELDRQIDGLKRLEIRIPAYLMSENGETIRVRLSGE
ncbi:MAG: heparinase II/III family protein, partial [Bacteroidota bacterium]